MKKMKNATLTDLDRQAAREVQAFLPDTLLDAHAHLYRRADLKLPPGNWLPKGPDEATIAVWRRSLVPYTGEARLKGGLFIAMPFVKPDDMPKVNKWLLDQIADLPLAKCLAIVAPKSLPAQFKGLLENPRFAGFKPYHLYSSEKPTWQSSPAEYIPEWAWKMANERGLIITLHMVKDAALADPVNTKYIREHCRRYPNARLILAHAARGFHAPNTVKGLAALQGIENVWFDTSAICEAMPLVAILEAFGPRRLLWGSDFPVSETRGKCVTLGNGFEWLTPDSLKGDQGRLLSVAVESFRALKEAADSFGLDAEDLRDICAENLMRLLAFKTESGTRTQELYKHAKLKRIPGGTQLLSKRPEMLAPDQWPAYFREARGCETWDLDGRHYYDMYGNGIGACLLGFRDPDVTRAVRRRLNLGSMCTLNPPEEVELADQLCAIHPWASQVRFARTGGETAAVAVRIARATTDRSLVAIGGYHGWHDWYLAANLGESDALRGHLLPGLEPLGVPRELRNTTIPFHFDNRAEFQKVIDAYGSRLAAVVIEPCRGGDPEPGYLEFVRKETKKCGALLIIDEITIGWRLYFGGAHLKFGICPDMAIFAKALGNGHPIGAIIGTAEAMAGAHVSFISSTYWTESIGPVAALATLRKMGRIDVPAHVARVGGQVQALWRKHAAAAGLPVEVSGYPCLAHFGFKHEQAEVLRTLYTQMMLDCGFLASTGIYPTLAHNDEIVALYGQAIGKVFDQIAALLKKGDVQKALRGPVAHSGFRRLT
ncbi:MAG: aminotransferase class III-fold pyridoxal phosphate-dependent enzyme [Kiritimatiellaeota bacterium]|nr:aminotransferase class III-fold pyridoxal phosphate-dependent enzyme [Kiritimatiellota bacterium]